MQSTPRLPMYRSRFRNDGPLISAIDICNDCAEEFLVNPYQYLRSHPLNSPFRNPQFEAFLCRRTRPIAYEIHGLTYMLDLHIRQPNKLGALEREFFEDTFAAVQHSLADLPYPHTVGVITSVAFYRQHCWRLAALLYCNMALRTWERSAGMIRLMVTQLILSLQKSDPSSAWPGYSEVLLWIFSMGSFAASTAAERLWLVQGLRCVTRMLCLQSHQDLEALLMSFLYRQSTFKNEVLTIWEEINS